jgi:hypothetical protein
MICLNQNEKILDLGIRGMRGKRHLERPCVSNNQPHLSDHESTDSDENV